MTNLKKNKVRVKIKAVGVCASDVPRAFYNGAYNYPLIMGHEISGTIFESNSNKKKIKGFNFSNDTMSKM